MTKTEHYQLNQWAPTDRVLREDFNEDNRKIEEALGGISTRPSYEEIARLDILPNGRNGSAVIPSIDWKKYFYVHMEIRLQSAGEALLYTNDSRTFQQSYQIGAASSQNQAIGLAAANGVNNYLLSVHYDSQNFLSGFFMYGGIGICNDSGVCYHDWHTLNFYTREASCVITGGTVILRGFR